MHFLRGSIQSQLFLFTDEWEFALLHLLLESSQPVFKTTRKKRETFLGL